MSKAAERLADEYERSDECISGKLPLQEWDVFKRGIQFAITKIRARRDEIRRTYRFSGAHPDTKLADLFDDGAELGPDKPEPQTLIRRLAVDGGSVLVEVQTDGRCETISEAAAEAIRADERRKLEELKA